MASAVRNYSTPASHGLGGSVEISQPREPGTLSPQETHSYGFFDSAYTPQIPRPVVPKKSYGGGYMIPQRPTIDEAAYLSSYLNQNSRQFAAGAGEHDLNPSENIIESLEMQLQRLKDECAMLSSFKQPIRMEQHLLHLDPPQQPAHQGIEEQFVPNTLEELNWIKSQHEARLIQIESEYNRNKHDAAQKQAFGGIGMMQIGQYAGTGYMQKSGTRVSPQRERYEQRFEMYLQNKGQGTTRQELQGHTIHQTEPKPYFQSQPQQVVFLKWMFSKLDKDKSGYIDKLELMQEFNQNPELAELFGFKSQVQQPDFLDKFNELFGNLDTTQDDKLTIDEFMMFFQVSNNNTFQNTQLTQKVKPTEQSKNYTINQSQKFTKSAQNASYQPKTILKNTQKPPKSTNVQKSARPLKMNTQASPTSPLKISPVRRVTSPKSFNTPRNLQQTPKNELCLLTNNQMKLLEEIWEIKDINQDLVLRRRDYIKALYEDERIIKILRVDALKLSDYQRVNLETLLDFIEQDGDGPDELITWNQFLEYFYMYPELISVDTGRGGYEDPRLDEIELPNRYMQLIENLFNDLPKRTRDKVSTNEFIRAMRTDPQVKVFLSLTARDPGSLSNISTESLNDVLIRMEDSAPGLISWNDVLGYLSKRGHPVEKEAADTDQAKHEHFVKFKSRKAQFTEGAAQTDNIEQKDERRIRSVSPKARKSEVKMIRQPRLDRVGYQDYARSKSVGRFNITVPEPFSFTTRDLIKPKGIRQRWLDEYVAEIQLAEEREINYRYMANPVPAEVTIPKFDSIKAAQEARRLEVKRQSIEMTKANEKPFSFYYRDQEKIKQEPTIPKQETFKANPIPWACSVPLFKEMTTVDKAKREERIAIAAQESLRKASLPPRMEMHEKMKTQQKMEEVIEQEIQTRFKAKDPPNFKRLQEKFQNTLDAKKKSIKPTSPKPFNFKTSGRRKNERNYLNTVQDAQEKWGVLSTNRHSFTRNPLEKPEVEPKITNNVRKLMEYRKKKLEDEERKQQKLQDEQNERQARYEQMKGRVQNSQVIVNKTKQVQEDIQNSIREKQLAMRERDKAYKQKIKQMKSDLQERPLMVETISNAHSKNSAIMKALVKVKRNLVEQKINPNSYFTKEESLIIEEAEYLIKHNKLHIGP